MNSTSQNEQKFDWPVCYEAETFVLNQLDAFTSRNAFARRLAERMRTGTGTLLMDWVDYFTIPENAIPALLKAGFIEDPLAETRPGSRAFWHPQAMLPRVLVEPDSISRLAIRCDLLIDFIVAHQLQAEPAGAPLSRLRRLLVSEENGVQLQAVERRGYRGFLTNQHVGDADKLLKAMELWRARKREFGKDADGFGHAQSLLDRLIELVGRNLACHVVFAEERAYWQGRNAAAQIQKGRQDKLGLGWANHDHHTFRSSREHFIDLMRALEKLGFERRERYYAGNQAGWGAQILEQPIEGIVAFCDVDLEPGETEIDFSRERLAPSRKLGTIGLWVGLHGESFLQAGMHHLECRFDYQSLRDQLAALGVSTMKPFSDFAFLKQAFTEGERWTVQPSRAEHLLRQGLIDRAQFDQFVKEGAIGSHLENLQRRGGFKGFNQKSVSAIIRETDPRSQHLAKS